MTTTSSEAKKPEPSKKDAKKDKKDKKEAEEDLSEEDQQLKDALEANVEQALSADSSVQAAALNRICDEVKSATTSMTAVPKPLRFLRPHYATLKARLDTHTPPTNPNHSLFASVVSVLAMTSATADTRETLTYCLATRNPAGVVIWGHEYMRHLAGEIATEYEDRHANAAVGTDPDVSDLLDLVRVIIPALFANNAEPEACDLCMEVERVDLLADFCPEPSATRTCVYLTSCAAYFGPPRNTNILQAAFSIFTKFHRSVDAARVALKIGSPRSVMEEIFVQTTDPVDKQQLMYLYARQGVHLDLDDGVCAQAITDDEQREDLRAILGNAQLSERYLALARDLDLMAAKGPEDVYKTGSSGDDRVPVMQDSARGNLASTFVNAFLNAGFGIDKLVLPAGGGGGVGTGDGGGATDTPTTNTTQESTHWIYKNKDHGKMSAAASMGMVMLWDVENGLSKIDRLMYTDDPFVTAGACLAVGVTSCGVRLEMDPALALLSEKLDSTSDEVKIGAILGLGLAYAGTGREEVVELLAPIASETDDVSMDVSSIAALAMGLTCVGSPHDECTAAILSGLTCRSEVELGLPLAPLMVLGLGLTYLGRQEDAETTIEVLKTLPPRINKTAETLLLACAYCGTGSVLVIQRLLAILSSSHTSSDGDDGEHGANVEGAGEEAQKVKKNEGDGAEGEPGTPAPATGAGAGAGAGAPMKDAKAKTTVGTAGTTTEGGGPGDGEDEDDDTDKASWHGMAVLGLAIVAMGEELGTKMSTRVLDHVFQYGDRGAKRAVPLAHALLHVSSPELPAMDVLHRYCHDADPDVAASACLSLGLVGAGTNNARLANMLRQLTTYFYKEPSNVFLVRVSQGLVHAGKGLLTMAPFHTDRQLTSGPAMGALLTVAVAGLRMRATLAAKHHYLLYTLSAAMYPRMFMPVTEKGEIIQTPARVGQAVDVVAQAGRPKTVTGFQTHTTPVLLGWAERAEMASGKYIARSSVLEGLVVCTEDPDYVEEVHEKNAA